MTPFNPWLTLTKYSLSASFVTHSLSLSLSQSSPLALLSCWSQSVPPALNVPPLPTPLCTATPSWSPSLHPLLPTLSFRGTPPTPSEVRGLFSGFEFFINGFFRFCLKNFYIFSIGFYFYFLSIGCCLGSFCSDVP
jgi:hypothetical protein